MKFLDGILGLIHFPVWITLAPLRVLNLLFCKPNSVCIIKLAAMGDVICLYPTIYSLARSGYDVVLITTNRSNPKLFKDCKAISKVILLNLDIRFFFFSLVKIIINILKSKICINADQYYNLSKYISYASYNSTGFKTRKSKEYYKLPVDYSYIKNEKYQFLKLAIAAIPKINFQLPDTDLFASHKTSNKRTDFKNCVLLYPGSGPSAKIRRWPIDKWIKLYFELRTKGYNCKFIGGPQEEEFKEILISNDIHKNDIHLNKLPFNELIKAMTLGSAFIGNDAGLFHVADALRLPVVGIFGPNLSSKWGSIRPESAHLELDIECRPCISVIDGIVPDFCKHSHRNCIKNITIKQVIKKFESLGIKKYDF